MVSAAANAAADANCLIIGLSLHKVDARDSVASPQLVA
jgi:hypothetical protein